MKFDAIIISPGLFPVSPSPSPTKPAQAQHQAASPHTLSFHRVPFPNPFSSHPSFSLGIEPIHSHLHSFIQSFRPNPFPDPSGHLYGIHSRFFTNTFGEDPSFQPA